MGIECFFAVFVLVVLVVVVVVVVVVVFLSTEAGGSYSWFSPT